MKPISSAKIRRSPAFWILSLQQPCRSGRPSAWYPTRAKIPNLASSACIPRIRCSVIMSTWTTSSALDADVSVRLEEAAQVAATTGSGAWNRCAGKRPVDAAGPQTPPIDERLRAAPCSRVRRQSRVVSWVATAARGGGPPGTPRRSPRSPRTAPRGDGHRLDGQRPVRALVTARRGRRTAATRPATPRRPGATPITASPSEPVRCHSSWSPGAACPPGRSGPCPRRALPDDVVGGHVQGVTALVCRRMTSRTPFALSRGCSSDPCASKILVPTASPRPTHRSVPSPAAC